MPLSSTRRHAITESRARSAPSCCDRLEDLASQLREPWAQSFVSHDSLSLGERRRAEEAFASGSYCAIVSTSTVDLGIHVGDLDRVIQLDAP